MPWFLHLQAWKVWTAQQKNVSLFCTPPFTTTGAAQEKLFKLLKTLKKRWYCSSICLRQMRCGKQLSYLDSHDLPSWQLGFSSFLREWDIILIPIGSFLGISEHLILEMLSGSKEEGSAANPPQVQASFLSSLSQKTFNLQVLYLQPWVFTLTCLKLLPI